MLMMTRAMTPDMVIAERAFLPPAPIVKTGIYARDGLNIRRIMPLVQILEGLLRPLPGYDMTAAYADQQAGEKPGAAAPRAAPTSAHHTIIAIDFLSDTKNSYTDAPLKTRDSALKLLSGAKQQG